MNQSEYKDSDFCILTFFRAGEVRRISCYSRYTESHNELEEMEFSHTMYQ